MPRRRILALENPCRAMMAPTRNWFRNASHCRMPRLKPVRRRRSRKPNWRRPSPTSRSVSSSRSAKRGAFEIPSSLPLRASFLGFFGLLLGAILALVLERLNRRIDTRPELAEACQLPIIAEVGFVPEKRRPTEDGALLLAGVWAESYRRVRSAMQFVHERGTLGVPGHPTSIAGDDASAGKDGVEHGGVFMFTSTAPGEGKTTSAALTAQAMAEVGVRTLLVGADFRRPTLGGVMGVEAGPTIADLTGPAEDRPKVDQVVRPTKFANLYLALSGRPARRERADCSHQAAGEPGGLAERDRDHRHQPVERLERLA